jgi:paraquat-inducible protein B
MGLGSGRADIMSGEPITTPQRTVAAVRKGRWPGWIWAVPLAAVGIVIWLVVREMSMHGVSVIVTFEDAAQMKPDTTKVMYRGIQVGKVSEVSLAKDGSKVIVRLDVMDEYTQYLNAGTRFYLAGAKPSLSDPASLKAIIAGPTINMMPGGGASARRFVGIAGEAPERLAVSIPYSVTFSGSAGDLKVGAPVTLQGFTVGEVAAVELTVDPIVGNIATKVGVMLDPLRFHIQGAAPVSGNWTPLMNATLTALIQHNLRARLSQSPPLLGSRQIELATVPVAPPATLRVASGFTEIPSVQGDSIEALVKAAGQLPIREIGDNVRAITQQVKTLVSSPKLKDSIAHLDDALLRLDQTLQEAGPKVAPTLQSVHDTVESLRHTASELDQTAAAARVVIGAGPDAPDGSLQPALLHMSEAARSVRVLADYLDQHPESLIEGR